jgi:hypothetical protein
MMLTTIQAHYTVSRLCNLKFQFTDTLVLLGNLGIEFTCLNLGLYTRLEKGQTSLLAIQKNLFTMLLERSLAERHRQMAINKVSIPSTAAAHTVGIFNRLQHIAFYTVQTCSKLTVLAFDLFADRPSESIETDGTRFDLWHFHCITFLHIPDFGFNFYAGTVRLFVRFHIPSQLEFSFHQRRHAADIFAQVSSETAAIFPFTSSGAETRM